MLAARVFAIGLIAALMLTGTSMGQISRTGLVAEWHFDEGAGIALKDSSENGNDGYIYGAKWVDGKYGKALSFDGVDDRVNLPPLINGLTDVSSIFWIKTTDETATVISGANSNVFNEYLIDWDETKEPHPHIAVHIKNKGYRIFLNNNAITDGNWHHLGCVRSGSQVTIYLDGEIQDTQTYADDHLEIDENGLWLGGEQDSLGGGWDQNQQFKGLIDEFSIYNRALTAEEIKDYYEMGQIIITSTPSGASIYLDEANTEQTTPSTLTDIPTGTHTVSVSLSDYTSSPSSQTVTVTSGGTVNAQFDLTPIQLGSISVSSTNSGASIYLDGFNTGQKTPSTLTDVPTGTHTVSVSLSDYTSSPSSQTVTVTSGGTVNAQFDLTPIQLGSISVSSTNSGASIYLDGFNTGQKTPSTLTDVPTGTHTVSVSLSDYTSSPSSQTVTVTSGGTVNAQFDLTPIQLGSISVSSTPSGASISLDGVDNGKITPFTLTDVPIGTRTVSVSLSDYTSSPSSQTVNVTSGGTVKAQFDLTPIPLPSKQDGNELPQLMGVILILTGLLFTAFTTLKKDITVEVGINEKSLRYIGGAGIMLVAIGTYVLLKCFELV